MTRESALLVLAEEGAAWRAGLVAEGGLLDRSRLVPSGPPRLLLDGLAEIIADVPARQVGVSRIVLASSGGISGSELAGVLSSHLGVPCRSVRRVDAMREGVRLHGTVPNARSLLALDTDGPEAALLIDGRAYAGTHGRAGGIVHLGLARTAPVPCRCGRQGCLGALLAAGTAAPEPPRPRGSAPARTRQLGWLAVAAIALLNVLNPEYLLVGGSLFAEPDDLATFAATVMSGCLAATQAGLSAVIGVEPDEILIGATTLMGQPAPGASGAHVET